MPTTARSSTSNRTGRSSSRAGGPGRAACAGVLTAALVLWAGAGAGTAPAVAAPPRKDDLQTHILEARKLYESKDYDGAIRELNIAYTIRQVPGLLLNLGHAYLDSGRPREALDYYDRYLAEETNLLPATRADVERYRVQAQEQLAKKEPATATPAPEPQRPADAAQVAAKPAPLPPSELTATPLPPENQAPSTSLPRGAIGLLAGGAAALIVGVGLGGAALAASKEVISKDGPFDAALDGRGKALSGTAVAFDIIGAVGLASGAAWSLAWYVRRNKTPASNKTGARPEDRGGVAVRPAGAGLVVLGTF